MLKCPLCALYDNAANHAYWPMASGSSSLIGNLIHHVYESLVSVVDRQESFDQIWDSYESTHCPDLSNQVNNYGKLKYMARLVVSRSFGTAQGERRNNWGIETEQMIYDRGSRLKGKPDLVILRNNRPYVIKDYKTGQITDTLLTDDDTVVSLTFRDLKAEYKNQLYLYAALVYSKYGYYPRYLAIVPADGAEITGVFDEATLLKMMSEIAACRQSLSTLNSAGLSNPSAENCRFCVFKPGCPYHFKDSLAPVTDIEGTVEVVQSHPYGNFSILLTDGTTIFQRQPDTLTDQDVVLLTGAKIYVSSVKRENDSKKLFLTTRNTKLFIKYATE